MSAPAFLVSSVPLSSSFRGLSPVRTERKAHARQCRVAGNGVIYARFNVFNAHDRYADWAAELFGVGNSPHVGRKASRASAEESLGDAEVESEEHVGDENATEDTETVADDEAILDDEAAADEEDAEEQENTCLEDDGEFDAHHFSPVGVNAGNPTYAVFNPEFRTARGESDAGNEDYTVRKVVVARQRFITSARDVVEIEVDVSGTSLDGGHSRPGMFCQLGVGERRGFFTIASRPDTPGTLAFLVGLRDDTLGLAQVAVGDTIRISPFFGEGLEAQALAEKDMKNLYVLVDCVQGYAAVRSLVDWDSFRSATGEGMNRTTRVTVAYSLPQVGSLPDTARFGEWAMFGINVVPVIGQSLVEFLQGGGLFSAFGSSAQDYCAGGLVCVASLHEAERVFSELSMKGVRRDRFCMFTEHRVESEVKKFNWDGIPIDMFRENYSSSSGVGAEQGHHHGRPWGMPDDVFEHVYRQQVEDQIWHAWVSIREPMRQEFERKWENARPNSRNEREEAAAAAQKKQAWESWFMRNKGAWNSGGRWEDVSWGAYWSGWRSEQDKWGTSWGKKASENSWARSSAGWSQQGSEEFWDRSSGMGGGGGGGASYDSYSSSYAGSSGSWGSSSTHTDSRGYRYTYEEPAGSQSSSSNYGSKQQNAWNNSRESSRRNYSGKSYSGSGHSSSGFSSTSVDFYAILGVQSTASGADIKKAYRKAALANHPDLNPGPGSTERMQEVVVAYMTLKDASKRQQYDRYGV